MVTKDLWSLLPTIPQCSESLMKLCYVLMFYILQNAPQIQDSLHLWLAFSLRYCAGCSQAPGTLHRLSSPFKHWRHFFTLALSISTFTLTSALLCIFLWDEYANKILISFSNTLCSIENNDYQFPLFLFSNFAKQVYSLASQGMCKVRVRLCLKPIQQWKRKVQKSQQDQ